MFWPTFLINTMDGHEHTVGSSHEDLHETKVSHEPILMNFTCLVF